MSKTITILSCKDNFSGYTEFEYEMPLADFKKEFADVIDKEWMVEVLNTGVFNEREV